MRAYVGTYVYMHICTYVMKLCFAGMLTKIVLLSHIMNHVNLRNPSTVWHKTLVNGHISILALANLLHCHKLLDFVHVIFNHIKTQNLVSLFVIALVMQYDVTTI